MNFDHSPQTAELITRFDQFFKEEIEPAEEPMLRELLANDDARQKIAVAGCREVREKHSLEARLNRIFELAGLSTCKESASAVQQ